MNVLAIVQARTTSERLPGKVLADLDGRPVIAHLIDRLSTVRRVDHVVLGVPQGDAALIDWAHATATTVRQGDEHDVLGRFADIVEEFAPEVVVRLTGDCPLLDPVLVDAGLEAFVAEPCDYQTFEGYPRGTADIEIVPAYRLLEAAASATEPWDREHVMPWLRNPGRCSVRHLAAPPDLWRPHLRLCIDEMADLVALRALCDRVSEPRTTESLVAVLDDSPGIAAINAGVVQRS